tara:strand:- start:724 stop:1146 length:423 start_codon:yes stop_codon:yes gene_type:complete
MKITRNQLRRIIAEEMKRLLEGDPDSDADDAAELRDMADDLDGRVKIESVRYEFDPRDGATFFMIAFTIDGEYPDLDVEDQIQVWGTPMKTMASDLASKIMDRLEDESHPDGPILGEELEEEIEEKLKAAPWKEGFQQWF